MSSNPSGGEEIEAIAEAAVEWVEAIHDPPNWWAGDEEMALIEAVFAAFPAMREPMEAKWRSTAEEVVSRG